jgi:hypothetical protein
VSSPRTPASPNREAAEGIPDSEELTPEQAATGQYEGVLEPPHDFPLGVEGFGTTPAEQREGESLDGRLAREEPTDAVHPDESGRAAEESAMHLEPGT